MASTYRRNSSDIAEVTYIRTLIDEDVKARLPTLAAGNAADLKTMRDLLNRAEKWRQMEADLKVPVTPIAVDASPDAAADPVKGTAVNPVIGKSDSDAAADAKPGGDRKKKTA
jgi:hypothetical protein